MSPFLAELEERFIRYVKIDTTAEQVETAAYRAVFASSHTGLVHRYAGDPWAIGMGQPAGHGDGGNRRRAGATRGRCRPVQNVIKTRARIPEGDGICGRLDQRNLRL